LARAACPQAPDGARQAFRDGPWLAELGGLQDPALLVPEVTRSLRPADRSARWAVAALSDYLQGKHMLLVLDGCEHLADACAVMADALLRACPQLAVEPTTESHTQTLATCMRRMPAAAKRPVVPASGHQICHGRADPNATGTGRGSPLLTGPPRRKSLVP